MATSLTSTGVKFDSGNRTNIGVPFQDRDAAQNSVDAGGSYVRLWDTKDFVIPPRSAFTMHFRTPARNDTTGWGGGYVRQYYSTDSGSNWIYLGTTGYLTAMMQGKYAISGHNHMAQFDFTSTATQFNIRFRFDVRAYDNTFRTGGSSNVANGDSTYTGTASNWWQNVTINGFSYPA